MKATKIKLKNFRSFGPDITEIRLENDLTGIVGANSSGKTALLEAFRKIFSSNNLERTIQKSDFHIPGGVSPTDVIECELFVEVTFEFEEAKSDEHTTDSKMEEDTDTSIPSFFEHMVVSEPDTAPYLRIRLYSKWQRDPINVDGYIETQMVYITCPEGEEENDGNMVVFPSHKRSLIQSFYVPAIRRPSDQLKFVSGSVLHRLFKKVKWPEEFETEFKEKLSEINDLFENVDHFGNIQRNLATLWSNYNKDSRYHNASIAFGSSDLDSILKKLEIEFSPTDTDRPFRIDELGEGYRSLFYLTLVSTLLQIENELDLEEGEKPFLTLLLIEEPENHIAPQLLGRVLGNLKKLSKQGNVQVVLSSHTPTIISRIEPEAIRHLRLDESTHKTISSNIVLPDEEDEAFKFVKEAVRNYPEIYFSKLVVLGEGDSEEIIFKMLARTYERDFDDHFISVVPLGGRYVNHIWKLLAQLQIPYVTLLDLDRERGGAGWGRVKYALNQIIAIRPEYRNEILELSDGSILSDKELKGMHKWDVKEQENMNGWIEALEEYDVFFSAPLDLDFMMLSAFEKEYKATANSGPHIPDRAKEPEKFKEKVETGVQATPKSEKATGETYTEVEKELMIWYNYLFLGRGKPSTHILAMSNIAHKDLTEGMPNVLERMFAKIKEKIQ